MVGGSVDKAGVMVVKEEGGGEGGRGGERGGERERGRGREGEREGEGERERERERERWGDGAVGGEKPYKQREKK